MGLIISKLKYADNWTQSEKHLVRYILDHQKEVTNMSSRKLAEKAGTSISTVYRVCDKLDLNGFNDLKLLLVQEGEPASTIPTDYNIPFREDATDYEIMQAIQNIYLQTVSETMSLMDLATLHQAAMVIDKADQLNLYTCISNRQPLEHFKHKCLRLGKKVQLLTNAFEQQLAAFASDENTVSILLSYAGLNAELTDLMPELIRRKGKLIVISSMLDHTFADHADYHFYLCSREKPEVDKIAPFSLNISASYILDVLYSVLYRRHYEAYQERMNTLNRDLFSYMRHIQTGANQRIVSQYERAHSETTESEK